MKPTINNVKKIIPKKRSACELQMSITKKKQMKNLKLKLIKLIIN